MKKNILIGLLYLLSLYVPLLVFSFINVITPFEFFTSDTYYYLATARHTTRFPLFTFDGINPTNGFHPLWQYFLTLLFNQNTLLHSQEIQVLTVLGISVLLVTLGIALFGTAVYRLTDNFIISLLAAIPGFYFLFFATIAPQLHSPWAFMNGMESPLSIFTFGLLINFLLDKTLFSNLKPSKVIFLSSLLTLLTLSRLDDFFIFVPFTILIGVLSTPLKKRILNLVYFLSIPFLVLGAYLLFNLYYAGLPFPISGSTKSGFWAELNISYLISAYFPFLIHKTPFTDWAETTMRSAQIFIPCALAIIWGLFWLKRKKSNWSEYLQNNPIDTILIAFCGYVLLKGGYTLLFVEITGQGQWYFPVSIMIFNLLIALLLNQTIHIHLTSFAKTLLNTGVILSIILLGNVFSNSKILEAKNNVNYNFWVRRTEITEQIKNKAGGAGIIEFDDGIISYSLDIPTMSGLGFSLDKEAALFKKNGSLLDIAYQRGFRVIGSVNPEYIPLDITSENSPDYLRKALSENSFFAKEDLNKWTFSVIYRDPITNATFVKFGPN